MSILLSIRMTRVGRWLIRKVDEYHTQNFSSDSDFPFAFAKKILYLPVMWLLVMWIQFLVDSQLLKAFIDLFLAAWQIRFLCRILHPNKLIHSAQGQEAAAELCGFKNRWGLTNARKRLKDFDYDLIEKYVS